MITGCSFDARSRLDIDQEMRREVIIIYLKTRAVKLSYAWNVVLMICYDMIVYLRGGKLCYLNEANCEKQGL